MSCPYRIPVSKAPAPKGGAMEEKKKIFPVLSKVVLGLGFLILGLLACFGFWEDLWALIRGFLGPVLLLVGIVFLAVAKD